MCHKDICYSFGKITIDGREYDKDVIILPGKVIFPWIRKSGHLLAMDDLKDIGPDVETLIIGTGKDGLMEVPEDVILALEEKGITVIVKKTDDAVKIYKEICTASLAVHITC